MKTRPKAIFVMILLLSSLSTLAFTNFASALRYPMDHDVSIADASFLGERDGDRSGRIVSIAGDVNGDGFDDILIGAASDMYNDPIRGEAYLVLGRSSGWSMDQDLSNADASFIGENDEDRAGWGVSGAGDVNGDGYDDILISSEVNTEGGWMSGQTYLILGKKVGWSKDVSLSNADASFIGDVDDHSGSSVSAAGDVNGDGFDDILINAYLADGGPDFSGKVYLVLGKAKGWTMDMELTNSDASFIGENAEDRAGYSSAGVGDVNGDGFDDILIGAWSNDEGGSESGQVYLILGRSSGWSNDVDLSEADASFIGEGPNICAGLDVARVGDVNGDGLDDIFIGADGDVDRFMHYGRSYIFFGRSSGWEIDTNLSTADASFVGESNNDDAGRALSGAGDVNGDGFNDLLIGAYGWGTGPGGFFIGQAYIILGKSTGWSTNVDLSNADASFIGEEHHHYLGVDVSGGGDVNGDGFDDIILGAKGNGESGPDAGQTYLFFPDLNTGPSTVTSIKAFKGSDHIQEISEAEVDQTVYIELNGTDGDPARPDIALARVTSDMSSPVGLTLRLQETGPNTGIFRKDLTIKDRTDPKKGWIKSSPGENVTIRSLKDPSVSKVLNINPPPVLILPENDNKTAIEDVSYLNHYLSGGLNPISNWVFESNGSWLEWDDGTQDLSGLPTNADVGRYWVRINATDGMGNHDEHNFTLTVINVPPSILNADVNETDEDQIYQVDYDSDDDGQGNITWAVRTDAAWLSIVEDNGTLSGSPTNDDVGQYRVNVTVNDGNGGIDWSNFSLKVNNTNDPPIITTENVTIAYEDELYMVEYNFTDEDPNDTIFIWAMETNASWLGIDNATGLIGGTPDNGDVGSFNVSISIKDRSNATDHQNFTLEVMNKPPTILTTDITETMEDTLYEVDYESDDDGQGTVTWDLATNALWLEFDRNTGILNGTPENDDVGSYWVNISVDDGNGGQAISNFVLNVTNVNDPPVMTSTPSVLGSVDEDYSYDVNATDVDIGDDLTYGLSSEPLGMMIDGASGLITWTPVQGQEGVHEILVHVSDNSVTIEHTFNLTISPKMIINITDPTEDQRIKGRYTMKGTVIGPANTSVEINIDDTGWVPAKGAGSWTFEVDSEELENGEHIIKARAISGPHISEEVTVTFIVDNPEDPIITGLDSPWLFWLIILIMIISMVTFLLFTVLKSKGTRPDNKEEDTDQGPKDDVGTIPDEVSNAHGPQQDELDDR